MSAMILYADAAGSSSILAKKWTDGAPEQVLFWCPMP